MRVWVFALSFLTVSLIAALLLTPESRERGKKIRAAGLEFEEYKAYDIRPEGVFKLLIAKKGLHYADHEELEEPIFIQLNEGRLEGLSGQQGVLKGNIVTLRHEVRYWNNEGQSLLTEEAVYNRQTQVLKGAGGFTLEGPQGQMTGLDFTVDAAARTLNATEVKASLKVKE